jgi:DNA polymerase III subunit delta
MLYILHGENELQRQEALSAIIERSGLSPDLRNMNTEVLADAALTPGRLRQAFGAFPFLGDVRIVIVRDGLGKARGQGAEELVATLVDVPPTTWLIFDEGQSLSLKHPALAQATTLKAEVQHFALPNARELPAWIIQRAQAYGGRIDGRAAALLAQNIGSNLRLLDQEIRKLLLYTGDRKDIRSEDVQVMVPYVQSADVIFQMVDAVGQRDAREAASYLHRLLEVGEHPLSIFGMVVRQFRLLIQVRWLSDRRYTQQQILSRLKLHPFVARKIQAQSDQFNPVQLRAAYRLLMETDLAIKHGEMPAESALDLLVAQLTRL